MLGYQRDTRDLFLIVHFVLKTSRFCVVHALADAATAIQNAGNSATAAAVSATSRCV